MYIYAADQSGSGNSNKEGVKSDKNPQALISHYRTNFGFHDADELFFVRPRYDYECYEMVQSIEELLDNSINIWKQYEDIFNSVEDMTEIIP